MLRVIAVLVILFFAIGWLYWIVVAWARMLGRLRDWLNRNYYEEYGYDDRYDDEYEGVS